MTFAWCILQRYEIVNGVVEVDGVSKEDADIAVEGVQIKSFFSYYT